MSLVYSILAFLGIWITFAFLGFLMFWIWPRTILGWILVFTVGPIVFVAFEVIGEAWARALGNIPYLRHTRERIEQTSRHESFSSKRIAYRFIELVLFLAVTAGAIYLTLFILGASVKPIFDFLKQNYH